MPPRKLSIIALATAVAAASLIGYCSANVQAEEDQEIDYPDDFNVEDATNYYSIESTSLLKRSMLKGGFNVDDTVEINEAYLDFASRALVAEMERIEKIRDALYEAAESEEDQQTCSAEDGECKDDNEASGSENKAKDDKLSPEFDHFLTPDLKPGQAELLRWDDDGSIVQNYAARVGLPPQLVPTLKEYAKEMGLLDIMTKMLYDDPLPPDGARWFSFQSPYQKGAEAGEMRNFTWNVERPAKKWKSDMHWFNTADELSHEDALRALAKGGFDEVLKGIGEKFGLDTLNVDSFGFVAVTNCDRGFMHTDWDETGGRAFNFLVGVHSPDDAGPELIVENERKGIDHKGETYYGTNSGILVGDMALHGTRECDHRAKREVRITASIYLADPTVDNLSTLAGDTTSVFPPMEEVGEEWIWSQRGRHWRKDGGGDGLVGDLGRQEFEFDDDGKGCTKEHCNNGLKRTRNSCMKTCKVFMDDASEYKLGKERREVLGY
mmetsp:Transcript_9359/g.21104  ORF Transcript_9359/g.21104 Transcript_9359/m.21104 type:complete len:494 (-) Transcript_9359:987-2468(-)|eukprot:CAMPEP_0172316396 /NCGR_PEP_ID=MMETSP1058-20130122/28021_1 /TAXON_ID=83371 /ORGANISM="Detonula confervacea, Strain CCMP 353" /LENGTH=493 /DNA_ID=CAMNT_0013030695 /DNA_START=138 /DNA_END=1619 /DNA_ORIENTATION=+